LASRNASFHEHGIAGALLAPLKGFLVALLLLLGLILAAWIIDGVFVFRVWPDGLAALRRLLAEDFVHTSQLQCWCGDLPGLAAGTAKVLYAVLFKMTGIHDMGTRIAEGAALSVHDTIVRNMRNSYLAHFEAIQVAMIATQRFGVRLAMLAPVIPLLALAYGVAFADGLVQRAIRRASGGRESASLYHRAKHLQVVLLAASGALSLLLPVALDTRWIWVPGCVVLAILARLQWTYYKKHL
jgi:integrating conjugative element membrane protein (TIGR03747 family)